MHEIQIKILYPIFNNPLYAPLIIVCHMSDFFFFFLFKLQLIFFLRKKKDMTSCY